MSHKTESTLFLYRIFAATELIDIESILRSVHADVRIINDDTGKPWLCAKDLCRVISIAWSGSTLAGLPNAGRRRIPTPTASGTQSLVYIDATIFLCLIFRSDKPPARAIAEALRRRLAKSALISANTPSKSISGDRNHEYPIHRAATA